jgi:hypothetical protein
MAIKLNKRRKNGVQPMKAGNTGRRVNMNIMKKELLLNKLHPSK